eukprot:gene12792-15121_t
MPSPVPADAVVTDTKYSQEEKAKQYAKEVSELRERALLVASKAASKLADTRATAYNPGNSVTSPVPLEQHNDVMHAAGVPPGFLDPYLDSSSPNNGAGMPLGMEVTSPYDQRFTAQVHPVTRRQLPMPSRQLEELEYLHRREQQELQVVGMKEGLDAAGTPSWAHASLALEDDGAILAGSISRQECTVAECEVYLQSMEEGGLRAMQCALALVPGRA